MKPATTSHDQLLYQDQAIQVGRFWISADDNGFADTGPIQNHILVFPALPVEIQYSRRERVVAEPMLAMCYNRGCEYRRQALNPKGDLCWWIAYEDAQLAGVMGTCAEQPFRHRWAPAPRDAFMVMRALVTELVREGKPDRLQLEDCAWWLMGRCLDGRSTGPRGNHSQEQVVERARRFLARHFRDTISLSDIAREACVSPFHLSRLFHRMVGTRLHQYLVDLRLRESVHEIAHSDRSLTDIALDLGFSSPSHFSTAFRTSFGMSPSQLRADQWSRKVVRDSRNGPGRYRRGRPD